MEITNLIDLNPVLDEFLEAKKASSLDSTYSIRRKLQRFQKSEEEIDRIMDAFELEWIEEQKLDKDTKKAKQAIKLSFLTLGFSLLILLYQIILGDWSSRLFLILMVVAVPIFMALSLINSVKESREIREAKWKNY